MLINYLPCAHINNDQYSENYKEKYNKFIFTFIVFMYALDVIGRIFFS